jgi:hypothetical protein
VYGTSFPGEMCPPVTSPRAERALLCPAQFAALSALQELEADDPDMPPASEGPTAVVRPAVVPMTTAIPPVCTPALQQTTNEWALPVAEERGLTLEIAPSVCDAQPSSRMRTSVLPGVRPVATAFVADISDSSVVPRSAPPRVPLQPLGQGPHAETVRETQFAQPSSTGPVSLTGAGIQPEIRPETAVKVVGVPVSRNPKQLVDEAEPVRVRTEPETPADPRLPKFEDAESEVEAQPPPQEVRRRASSPGNEATTSSDVHAGARERHPSTPTGGNIGCATPQISIASEVRHSEVPRTSSTADLPLRGAPDSKITGTPEPAPPSRPVREVVIQIGGSAGERVEVQVTERGGAVRVHVRTADKELTTSLRANLGELVRSITEKGLRIEAWTPTETWPSMLTRRSVEVIASVAEPTSAGQNANEGGPGDRSAGQEHKSAGNAAGDRGMTGDHGRGRARALWLEEMERRLGNS